MQTRGLPLSAAVVSVAGHTGAVMLGIEDIGSLQTSLNAKLNSSSFTGHTHSMTNISGLVAALDAATAARAVLTANLAKTGLRYTYTASAAQEDFSGVDDAAATMAYNVGREMVTLNGVVLVPGVDYTAADGTSVSLISGAAVGDILHVISL